MNQQQFDAVLSSQPSIARKVLQVLSDSEPRPLKKINQGLYRNDNAAPNARAVEACVHSLVEAGLVRENPRGLYVRLKPREKNTLTLVRNGAEKQPVETALGLAIKTAMLEKEARPPLIEEPAVEVAADKPFRIVDIQLSDEEVGDYQYYLSLRAERSIEMLKQLSNHVDDEVGLAILELLEDVEDTFEIWIDRISSMAQPICNVRSEIVPNPGWYKHELDGVTFFDKVETLSEEYIETFRAQRRAERNADRAIAEEIHAITGPQEAQIQEALFQKFEPGKEGRRLYFQSLLEKIKQGYTPSPAPSPSAISVNPVEAKLPTKTSRRGICDLRIPGLSEAAEYRAWCNIISPQRLETTEVLVGPKAETEWLESFKVFLKDIGYRPVYGAQLRRINLEAGWVRGNVEWRVEGKAVPGRERKPNGWPHMKIRDEEAKRLNLSIKENRKKLSALSK